MPSYRRAALNPPAIFAHATCSAHSGFDSCNLAFGITRRTAIVALATGNELKLTTSYPLSLP